MMKIATTMLGMCVLALGAGAATLTYDAAKAGAWGEASSWVENAAPAAGDTLVIPGDARLTDADAAAAGLADQITVAADATLTVDNVETLTLNGYVSGDGRLVKRGAGVLAYTKLLGPAASYATDRSYRLAGGTEILDGTIRFPLHDGLPGVIWDVGPMTVRAPGVLDVPANCNLQMNDLSGDGTILNSKGTVTQLRPIGTSVFDGFLCGTGIRVYTQANITFNCLTNTIAYDEFATWGGCITLPLFGMRGQPAPAGPNASLRMRNGGGVFRYSGTGETTDRVFTFWHEKADQFCGLDGGPNGGVTFTGRFETDRTDCWNTLVLTGDHAQPMTLAGGFWSKVPVAIVKRGTGTWYFKDAADNAANRQQLGLYEVEDGVLVFDSVANVGSPCALGPQTAAVPRTNAYKDISTTVDTAFILGGEAGKTGTLRHVGAQPSATDRLIGVAGRGRLENASDAALVWNGGARATGAASLAAELVLAGDTAAANAISNLRDGDDGKPLAVTKEGAATWTLGGGTTFSGPLRVNAGTLRVSPSKGAFTWYKWTIRENWNGRNVRLGGASGDTNVGARKIAFYDADGNDLSTGRFAVDTRNAVSTLEPYSLTYDGKVIRTTYSTGNSPGVDGNTGRNLDRLVDGQNTEWLVVPAVVPTRSDNAASHFSVVFRFPEGTPPAASYDVWAYAKDNNRSACAWTLYGSGDGTTWYELDRQDLDAVPNNWLGGNGSTAAVSPSPLALVDADDPSAYGLPNASVAVAAGAELVAGRTGLDLPSRLMVEPGVPQGRYAGFAVPQAGVVDIRAPLSWFRLTVLETVGGRQAREGNPPPDQNVQMDEFALYDAKGARRNVGLQLDPACDPAALQPGCVTYSRPGINYYGNRNADKLFDDAKADSGWCVVYGNKFVRRDEPSSWIQLTMRLADADPGIASYDWVSCGAPDYVRTVTSWRLEGSADGETWITLDEKVDFAGAPATNSQWWSDGARFARGQVRTGFPVSTDGMKGLVSFRDLAVPIDLADCTAVGNLAKWKVCVNGVEMPRVKMAYHDGALRALQSSTAIILR